MRPLLLVPALLLSLAAAAPSTAAGQAEDDRPGIAVLPFSNGGSLGPNREDLEPLRVGVQQMLLTELAQNPALRIVERSALAEVMEEQDLAASGRVDARTAARVGKLVGARYVVTGGFVDLYGTFRLDGRIVDVETGEVLRSEQVRDRKERLYDLLVQMAGKITRDVRLPPLPRAVQQARQARRIPTEAATLYSKALLYQDRGEKDKAVELYRSIAERFPEMTEAREALRQLSET
ncbi:MAG TPA: CsgG/HfaB family protein [Longimicrobiaceae bacterium]